MNTKQRFRSARKLLSSALIATMLSMLLVVTPAFAAAGEGSATVAIGTGGTGADDATFGSAAATGAVTVGELSYIHIALTVGASGIVGSENNITLQIPTNLFPTNGFDTAAEGDVGDVDAAGEWVVAVEDIDAGTTDNTNTNFDNSAAVNTGLITLQANENIDSTDIIHLYVAVQNTLGAASAAAIDIETDDTGENDLTDIGSQPTISVTAADAAATLTLGANAQLGATGDTTLALTLPVALAATDTIVFTMPSHVDVSRLDSAVTETFAGAGVITCAASGQVVTCTTDGAINAGTGTIVMTGIQTTGIATSSTITDLAVNNVGSAGIDFATDSSVAVTDTVPGSQASSTTKPLAPSGLAATVNDDLEVVLTWTDSVSTHSSVDIIRSTGEGVEPSAVIASVAKGAKTYTDTSVTEGQVVNYAVRASNNGTKSSLSSTVSITVEAGATAEVEEDTETEEDTTDEDTTDEDTTEEESEDVEMSYDEEKQLVQDEGIVTKEPGSAADKCEMLVMLSRVLDWELESSVEEDGFSDTPGWCKPAAKYAKDNGIVYGEEGGVLGMGRPMNRFEYAVVLNRVITSMEGYEEPTEEFEHGYTDEIVDWAEEAVSNLKRLGVMKGNDDGTFGGSNGILKVDAAIALWRAFM